MKDRKIKILTVFGTRAELIKLHPVLKKLKFDNRFESIVVSTSQHQDKLEDLFTLFNIIPDHDLHILRGRQLLSDISTLALSGLDPLMKLHKPDLVLVQGDSTTAFIGALAAFYNRIPVGHLEGGIRSFSKLHPYPEELNRKLISTIADLHFAPTANNTEYLISEGAIPNNIFITGNAIVDSLRYITNRDPKALSKYLPPDGWNTYRTILVAFHRRENRGRPLENLCEALLDLTQAYPDVQIVYSVPLSPNARKDIFQMLYNQERIHLLDQLPYETFVEAMVQSYLIISDSDCIREECHALRKPIIVFQKALGRPEALLTGTVKPIGLSRENIVVEISRLLENFEVYRSMFTEGNSFGDGQAAERIVQAIRFYFNLGARPKDYKPRAAARSPQAAMAH